MDYSKRRPMSDALQPPPLSEEARTFLTGMAQPTGVVPESLAPSPPHPPVPPPHPTVLSPKPPPQLSVVVSAIVSMTFRLPAALTNRLARVAAERKLQRQRPFSQQDIVAVALDEWLQRHGGPA
jgi:hypothetical protein